MEEPMQGIQLNHRELISKSNNFNPIDMSNINSQIES